MPRLVSAGCIFGIEIRAEIAALDQHAEDMLECEMGFLDIHRDIRRNDHAIVAEVTHFAAVAAGESSRDNAQVPCALKGFENVF